MIWSSSQTISCNSSCRLTTTTTSTTTNNNRVWRKRYQTATSINNNPTTIFKTCFSPSQFLKVAPKLILQEKRECRLVAVCRSSVNTPPPGPPPPPPNTSETITRDWTTSILLFLLWGALLFYVFMLTPNQTPSRDMYFLEKLLNLKGEDGFEMNQVLVSLWYIMGLWPLVYSMLLLPSGRSSNSKIPVWPFLVLSCFGGAYAILPYFVLWKPPPPSIEEDELGRWPLNFLESKLTAGILIAAGLGIITYAGLADAGVWKEFFQYCRESKFIHVTSLDFALLSTFAPFWVYNDMTARKWSDKGSWILPLSLIPFLGPAFYLVLRPSLSASLTTSKEEEG